MNVDQWRFYWMCHIFTGNNKQKLSLSLFVLLFFDWFRSVSNNTAICGVIRNEMSRKRLWIVCMFVKRLCRDKL